MATAKDCHTLTTYYEKVFKDKYGEKPIVNRNTARWSWDSILMGLSVTEVKSLLDYYLGTPGVVHRHALPWFFNNYEKLMNARLEYEKDAERRARLRKESEQRAKEWKARRGNQGIAND